MAKDNRDGRPLHLASLFDILRQACFAEVLAFDQFSIGGQSGLELSPESQFLDAYSQPSVFGTIKG